MGGQLPFKLTGFSRSSPSSLAALPPLRLFVRLCGRPSTPFELVDLHSEPQPVPESPVGISVLSMLVLPNEP